MASFRKGFKIFGELLLKEGLGQTRSFSEDRKPGQWLPEDQWAVRCPGSTCPPCEKPKKPAKPSKSWLSICKDPNEIPIDCDIRHNNCPSPPVKEEGPWYSLDNLIPKKKQEKPPPICTCKEELKRKEMMVEPEREPEVCESLLSKTLDVERPDDCPTKTERCEPCPAPVVALPAPPPKEIDIMLWCGQPSTDTCRIAAQCLSERLPYSEFRPQKCWKPPPFSLPVRGDSTCMKSSASCQNIYVAFSEFKYVEVPRPLYSRYKSVELNDTNSLFSMTNAKCPESDPLPCTALTPHPNPPPLPPSEKCNDNENELENYLEKPIIKSASCQPVRLKKAPKYTFQPKITKFVEKRVYRNPCAQHKNLSFSPQESSKNAESCQAKNLNSDEEPPKVITGCLTDEPQTFERNYNNQTSPPKWMYNLCKPGMKTTPLIPSLCDYPKEPDWSSETDGLNFYDGNNGNINPKPQSDPYKNVVATKPKTVASKESPDLSERKYQKDALPKHKNRFVLMPEKYNIKRGEIVKVDVDKQSFEKFIETKSKTPIESYQPIKENILYDLQRITTNAPFDPSKFGTTRKPPIPWCPQTPEFYRSYSTFSLPSLKKLCSAQLNVTQQRRTDCGDSSEKCKVRGLIPKAKECPEKKSGLDCAEILLPCCPKANIPPTCNQKTFLPPCKKKCAPKPSFSECARDLPPCPKPTECNCWDKKPWQKK